MAPLSQRSLSGTEGNICAQLALPRFEFFEVP
jgi:hypothetical protein